MIHNMVIDIDRPCKSESILKYGKYLFEYYEHSIFIKTTQLFLYLLDIR